MAAPRRPWAAIDSRAGYFTQRMAKLRDQHAARQSGDVPSIFAGCTVYIDGRTDPPAYELKEMVCARGGAYEYFFQKSIVTHFVATNLPDGKLKQLGGVTVVTPNWIVDSCARGELLPVGEYLYSRLRGDAGDDGQQRQLSDWFRAPQPLPLVSASGPSAAASQHVDAGEATADPTRAGAASAIADAEGEEGEKSEANDADDLLAHAEEDDEHLRAMGEELNRLDPNNPRPFVQKYYATSRLHFLSTWKLKFKALCQRLLEQRRADAVRAGAAGTSMGAAGLAASGDAAASAGGTLNTMDPSPTHVFIHFDIDAFFATVSLRDRPDLRGRPVVISHGSRADGSADVAACSYEARAFGVHNGMWLARARQLCPQLVVLPYEFDKYERVAVSFFTILCRTFAEVEAFSCDEAMVQTAAHGAERIAASVRDVIFAETRCTATAGIAHSPALARLATRMAKPNGQHFIAKGSEIAQVGHMAVGALHGVGHKYAKKLEQAGLRTVSDMSECRVEHLRELFGPRLGEKIWRTGRFEDARPLRTTITRKTIGAEVNWGVRFGPEHSIVPFIEAIAEEVASRMAFAQVAGRQVQVKVLQRAQTGQTAKFLGHGIVRAHVRSCTLGAPIATLPSIVSRARTLFEATGVSVEDVRGFGIHVQRLEPSGEALSARRRAGVASWQAWFERQRVSATLSDAAAASAGAPAATALRERDARPAAAQAAADLPRASQLDVAVLRELPRHIFDELAIAYRHRGQDVLFRERSKLRHVVQRVPSAKRAALERSNGASLPGEAPELRALLGARLGAPDLLLRQRDVQVWPGPIAEPEAPRVIVVRLRRLMEALERADADGSAGAVSVCGVHADAVAQLLYSYMCSGRLAWCGSLLRAVRVLAERRYPRWEPLVAAWTALVGEWTRARFGGTLDVSLPT